MRTRRYLPGFAGGYTGAEYGCVSDGSGHGRLDFGLVAGYGVPGGFGEFSCMIGDSQGGGVSGSDAGLDAVTDPLMVEVAKVV